MESSTAEKIVSLLDELHASVTEQSSLSDVSKTLGALGEIVDMAQRLTYTCVTRLDAEGVVGVRKDDALLHSKHVQHLLEAALTFLTLAQQDLDAHLLSKKLLMRSMQRSEVP